MKTTFCKFICILLFLSNCDKKETDGAIIEGGTITDEQYGDIFNENEPYKTYEKNKGECNKILISTYESIINNDNVKSKYAPFSIIKNYEIIDITRFDLLLKSAIKTGYCCCPKQNLSITFYNKSNKIDTYLVDNTQFKDTVIIFDQGYQFSYRITDKKWKKFLNESEVLNHKEYLTAQLNDARKIFNFSLKNNLVLETSNNVSKYWMYHDGEFYLNIKERGHELRAIDVVKKIKEGYPKNKIKVEVIYQKHNYKPDKSEYYDCEIEMKIYCSKNFYNKFKMHKLKSSYKETKAEFCVLGRIETLNKINNVLSEIK